MALHNRPSQQGSRGMAEWPLPPVIVLWVAHLATSLHARHAWRLLPLLRGLLFATGRRTVAAWLRAAALGHDYKRYYLIANSGTSDEMGAGSGRLGRRAGSEWTAIYS